MAKHGGGSDSMAKLDGGLGAMAKLDGVERRHARGSQFARVPWPSTARTGRTRGRG